MGVAGCAALTIEGGDGEMSEEDDYREYERECAREDEHWLDEQIEAAIEAERLRCAQICADRAAMLESTADQYPAGTAVCFAAEARECERLIRGEK